MPEVKYIVAVMILGFVAYGLSIFLYIRAQRDLGAAKTSAYYAAAPFVGSFLAFVINGEKLEASYIGWSKYFGSIQKCRRQYRY